jgi:hypothetical protein
MQLGAVDIFEVYSAPRVTDLAAKLDWFTGASFDLGAPLWD